MKSIKGFVAQMVIDLEETPLELSDFLNPIVILCVLVAAASLATLFWLNR